MLSRSRALSSKIKTESDFILYDKAVDNLNFLKYPNHVIGTANWIRVPFPGSVLY
jgi:hypothetical protein